MLTNEQMSSQAEEVPVETEGIQSDLYFGAERIADEEEQVYAEQDRSQSDSLAESDCGDDQNDSGFESRMKTHVEQKNFTRDAKVATFYILYDVFLIINPQTSKICAYAQNVCKIWILR